MRKPARTRDCLVCGQPTRDLRTLACNSCRRLASNRKKRICTSRHHVGNRFVRKDRFGKSRCHGNRCMDCANSSAQLRLAARLPDDKPKNVLADPNAPPSHVTERRALAVRLLLGGVL